MQIGLREWLLILGGLAIALILLDGWRRMRCRERDRMRFNLDRRFGFSDEEEKRQDSHNKNSVVKEPSVEAIADIDEEQAQPSLHSKEPERTESPSAESKQVSAEQSTQSEKVPRFEDVLVINVLAKNEKGFFGPNLLQCILESGLRFGERGIFHRHESKAGNGEVLFSMANAVKPGIFDLTEMDHCHIRAVAFYLLLPGPRNPKAAFSEMLAAVRKLENELAGEVKDDQYSVLTAQTIEHYRQRINEFERKRRLVR